MPELPARPSAEYLRKRAKRLARERALRLSEAQQVLANEYGFRNWSALMRQVETVRDASPTGVSPLVAAVRARDLEAYFGSRAGRVVRTWMYGQLGEHRGGMAEALFAAYPRATRGAARVLAPLLEAGMRKKYRIDDAGIAAARAGIDEVFDRLEAETAGDPARYLVGDALSIADITAASLLGPLVAPLASPWAVMSTKAPASVLALRAELSRRPGWAWVEARYARDRHA